MVYRFCDELFRRQAVRTTQGRESSQELESDNRNRGGVDTSSEADPGCDVVRLKNAGMGDAVGEQRPEPSASDA